MRRTVIKLLRPLDAVSVENGIGEGTPDVNCTLGWIELKSVDLPVNPDTKVSCTHFTTQQKVWLRRRMAKGGLAVVLLKAGQWWLLLEADPACELLGKVPLSKLVESAYDGWLRQPKREELIGCLEELADDVRRRSDPGGESLA